MGVMGMTSCEHVLERLWEFLDEELSPDEEVQVQQHLNICNQCFPRYDFQRAYFEYAHRIRDRDHASPELRRRVFKMILEQEAEERPER